MNQKGITLIELLITLVISAIVIAGAYQVFINQAKIFSAQEVVADSQNAVRIGMQIMLDDLRNAGYDKISGDSKVPDLTGGSWNSIPIRNTNKIKVEWEHDNNTIKGVEYFLSNDKLQRNVYLNGLLEDDCPQTVLDDVTGLTFAYTLSGSKVTKANVTLSVKNRTLTSAIIFRNIQ